MSSSYLALIQAFSGNLLVCMLAFFCSLIVVVALHEFGHYIAARLCGVRIQKFSIGFGKELWGRTDKRGTRWSFSAIPLGGYLEIFGDVDHDKPEIPDPETGLKRPLTPEELKEAFFAKPVWQKILIVAAGPGINFLLAVLIFAVLFSTKGQVSNYPIVTTVALGTSGYEAGFRPFDEITAIDGHPVTRFEDVWDYTLKHTGVPYQFTVKRRDKEIILTAASRPVEYRDPQGITRSHGRIGATHIVGMKLTDITSVNGVPCKDDPEKARALILENMGKDVEVGIFYSRFDEREDVFLAHVFPETNKDLTDSKAEDYDKAFFWKSKDRLYHVYPNIMLSTQAAWVQLGKILDEGRKIMGVLLTGGGNRNDLGGVVTMGGIAGKAAQSGVYSFFLFVAALSVQIGFINLLPVPVLDGGYLLFFAFEVMTKRRISARFKELALYGGMVFLFGIMIIANLNDIFQMTRP